jgi:hypothetical protein
MCRCLKYFAEFKFSPDAVIEQLCKFGFMPNNYKK